MAKGKERGAAELRRGQEEHRKRGAALQPAIDELKGLIREDLAGGRDTVKRRDELARLEGLKRQADQDVTDLQDLVAEADAREQAAAAAAEEEALRVDALALQDEGAALAKALQEDLLRHQEALRPLEGRLGDLNARWEHGDRGTFYGAHELRRAARAVREALRILGEGGAR